MSFRINVPPSAPALFGAAVDRAIVEERLDPGDAPTQAAVTIGATALKRLVQSWGVALKGRTIAASLSGHANPDGEAPAGVAHDRITLDVWRAS